MLRKKLKTLHLIIKFPFSLPNTACYKYIYTIYYKLQYIKWMWIASEKVFLAADDICKTYILYEQKISKKLTWLIYHETSFRQ